MFLEIQTYDCIDLLLNIFSYSNIVLNILIVKKQTKNKIIKINSITIFYFFLYLMLINILFIKINFIVIVLGHT